MYSKDLEIVINRIEQEMGRHQSYIGEMYQGKRKLDAGFIEVAKEYKIFANGTITMIEKIDKEIKERGKNK